jgi:hypothetical protein
MKESVKGVRTAGTPNSARGRSVPDKRPLGHPLEGTRADGVSPPARRLRSEG